MDDSTTRAARICPTEHHTAWNNGRLDGMVQT
jgi:hypothetical protein